jgi:hypothetical protein
LIDQFLSLWLQGSRITGILPKTIIEIRQLDGLPRCIIEICCALIEVPDAARGSARIGSRGGLEALGSASETDKRNYFLCIIRCRPISLDG